MMFLYLFLLFVPAWTAVLPQKVVSTESVVLRTETPDDYRLSDIEWRGFPDFDGVVFKGTIQNVIHQMKKIKGVDYTPDFVSKAENQTLGVQPAAIDCDQEIKCGGPKAKPKPVSEGVDYLLQLSDTIMCSNGPTACGRISCSWDAAIIWCNDKAAPSNSFKCKMFAGYADAILGHCSVQKPDPLVSGKNTDYDLLLSVIVEKQACD
ncbi:hypothetical protein GQX73_g1167 [Xylaria multiplex]|uniref:Ecp2 effector protein domain-containing protein n=1 Tax=Xylaria multiplex TaxID=323545 RepID=A0A7C8IUC6_9PEZI|nr:hypothetical protein GQX73_g1167 [Xylaria multiplex]